MTDQLHLCEHLPTYHILKYIRPVPRVLPRLVLVKKVAVDHVAKFAGKLDTHSGRDERACSAGILHDFQVQLAVDGFKNAVG